MSALSHTEREICSQPEVWRETLDALDVSAADRLVRDSDDVVVTGCGSTYYLALSAAALLRAAGVRAWAVPSSELLTPAGLPVPDQSRATLLAFSRSGTTTETVRAAEQALAAGTGTVAAVTCDPDSTLAELATLGWHAPAAAERSVAQTRSFGSMQLIGQALAATVAGGPLDDLRRLPGIAADLLDSSRASMADLARDPALSAYFFLGSGPLFGLASEAMLKLKEMSLTSSEAYHTLEFRHGPMSMCGPETAVVGLLDPARAVLERAVFDDIAPFGPRILTVGAGAEVSVPTDLDPYAAPVLHLLPLQLLALERALAKGLDPDSPRHLVAVIRLDDRPEPVHPGGIS
ncbi:SIS domain-containing protein [Nocardioides sp.]|uniref:SIS domain-containing protein n=1 Tax=Nocardioides sp. TaxID=35761 RepID=UPI003528B91F